MTISIIIPVGDKDQWAVCEASIRASLASYDGAVRAEVLPCFDLEHRGAYVARNEGLARATGEWIAWVDCDDLVEPAWFGEIARAIEAHPDSDVVQFDTTEVKNGAERVIAYAHAGRVSGDAFAHELLRNDGMPAWLWTRVFRKALFDGLRFQGRTKQDYRIFLEMLPRIHAVWAIGKPLYRYVRHGHGLSNYLQTMDYRQAGEDFKQLIERLPGKWWWDARLGLAIMMADVALHSREENGSRVWVRRYGLLALVDLHVSIRLKIKCLLAMFARLRVDAT